MNLLEQKKLLFIYNFLHIQNNQNVKVFFIYLFWVKSSGEVNDRR